MEDVVEFFTFNCHDLWQKYNLDVMYNKMIYWFSIVPSFSFQTFNKIKQYIIYTIIAVDIDGQDIYDYNFDSYIKAVEGR